MDRNLNNNNKAVDSFNPLPRNEEDTKEIDIPVAPTNPPRPVSEESIMNSMHIALCDRDEASRALYRKTHDVYDALASLCGIEV